MSRSWFLVFLLLATLSSVRADRGSIPFRPFIRIFEPVQRAMIAWNAREEILLLSTDLHSSQPTKVHEVIPMPAEPVGKAGRPAGIAKETLRDND